MNLADAATIPYRAIEPGDLDMSVAAMGLPRAPKPEARCEECHSRGHSGNCGTCVYWRGVFASIPSRSRALVGSGR
jgi:hypothetical protein